MSVSVKRLRVWLLVGASLLVLVIGGFLGYAHYRAHRFLAGLPGTLGVDIQREADGYTYSQSVQGKTVFTIHAAKAVQHKDGKTILHNVGIVLYGRGQSSSDRVDRIYGSEFEYDQSAEVIRAMGEVHIDLQAPAAADAHAKIGDPAGWDKKEDLPDDERLIHVKTSGLVFLKKLGVAATDQDLEFEFRGMTGHAKGADYSSDTGVLVLQSAVKVNGLQQGQPVVLTAERAELNRQSEQVLLTHAKYVVVGGTDGGRTAEAEKATVHMRRDGSVELLQAEGGVRLATEAGAVVTGSRGEVRVSAANQPESAVLRGAVRLVEDGPLRQMRGEAEEGRAAFDKEGRVRQVGLTGGVHLHERVRAKDGEKEPWSERELAARNVELGMISDRARRVELRDAKAEGDARLTVLTSPVAGAKSGHTGGTSDVLAGDVLTAVFVTRDGAAHVKTVHGAGHTLLRRVSDTGAVLTSSGETLDAAFRSDRRVAARTGTKGQVGADKAGAGQVVRQAQVADEVATVVQQGHVSMTNHPAGKAGVSATSEQRTTTEQTATADRAAYDGDTNKLMLTGAVQVMDGASVLWTDRLVMERESGDATADGSVKVTYVKEPGAAGESVHVLAGRAELQHAAGLAMFYGVAGSPARLWQGGSQVAAPVLQFEQQKRRMLAKGAGQGAAMAVHAVFVNVTETVPTRGASGRPGTDLPNRVVVGDSSAAQEIPSERVTGALPKRPAVVRIASREMTYDDIARRAVFNGGVQVESVDGTMRGQEATLFLQRAKGSTEKPVGQSSFLGGSVERIVATGRIEMEQAGRRALGEQVVYTAADGMFVMTGTPGSPPKMVDATRGTITGTSLRFHAGDNSVVVSNGTDHVVGERVRTETQVKSR